MNNMSGSDFGRTRTAVFLQKNGIVGASGKRNGARWVCCTGRAGTAEADTPELGADGDSPALQYQVSWWDLTGNAAAPASAPFLLGWTFSPRLFAEMLPNRTGTEWF